MTPPMQGDHIETEGYTGPERRREVHLTEKQIEAIAERAASKAAAKVVEQGYQAIGKNVIQKGFWLVGAAVIGFGAARGWIKLG